MSQTEQTRRIGSFQLEDELGRDELGAWYRATDERLGRVVALRLWRFERSESELRDEVRQRARIAASLIHPCLPTVWGREEHGRLDVLSVEYIDGDSVAHRLEQRRGWRPLDAARVVAPLADALAAAHAAGVVHGRLDGHHIRLVGEQPVLLGLGVVRERAEVAGDAAERALQAQDVRNLALVLQAMYAPGLATSRGDPMFAVEAGLLEPVLEPALRERARRPVEAAAFRDALLRVSAPSGYARRSPPPPPPVSPVVGGPPPPVEPLRPAAVAPSVAAPTALRPSGEPRRGNMEVIVPERRGARGAPAFLRIAAGLVLGILLAAGGVYALRPELFERGLRVARLSLPVERGEPALAAASRDDRTAPPPAPPPAPAAADTGPLGPAAEQAAAPTGVVGADRQADTPPPVVLPPPAPPPPPPAATEARQAETPDESAPTQSAGVTVAPADAMISRAADGQYLGLGSAVLSVARGDTTMLEFARAGYLPVRMPFTGEPLRVEMRPDSVRVTFTTNVPVEVAVETSSGMRVLGTAPLTAQLASGDYRVHFRSPLYPEHSVETTFPRAGASYRVSKIDYPTRGALVVAVPGGWANVSLNGGPPRESPARFEDLPVAPHIVRITRDGFETIVDTVRIRPGEITTQQYTLRPRR